jgi:Flp pilus assembly protein TadD
MNLEAPHLFHVRAASGWLDLGNLVEARSELAKVPESLWTHPAVLEVRWLILAGEKEWLRAKEVAEDEVTLVQDSPSGWLHRAYAVRRLSNGGLDAAWEVLLPAAERFPKDPIVPFNLACYACQLGRLDEARDWLRRAMRAGGIEAIRQLALADPDLAPLHRELTGGTETNTNAIS